MFIIKEGTPADKVGEGTTAETIASINNFLKSQGYVVRTADEEKAFLTTATQSEINRVLGERNTQFEGTIQKATGINKNAGEKFYDYFERAMTEKLADVTTLQQKIKDMEAKGVDGSQLAQQYKKELEDTQKKLAQLNQEWEEKVKAKDAEVFNVKVQNQVEVALKEFESKVDKTIKPELVQDIIAARVARFNAENKAKDLDGHIVFTDTNGVTRTSKQDGKPLSVKETLEPYFKDIIDTQRQQGGAGSGGQGGQGGQGGTALKWKEVTRPDTIKNQIELTKWLSTEQKLDASTKEYSEAYEALKGDLPIR